MADCLEEQVAVVENFTRNSPIFLITGGFLLVGSTCVSEGWLALLLWFIQKLGGRDLYLRFLGFLLFNLCILLLQIALLLVGAAWACLLLCGFRCHLSWRFVHRPRWPGLLRLMLTMLSYGRISRLMLVYMILLIICSPGILMRGTLILQMLWMLVRLLGMRRSSGRYILTALLRRLLQLIYRFLFRWTWGAMLVLYFFTLVISNFSAFWCRWGATSLLWLLLIRWWVSVHNFN